MRSFIFTTPMALVLLSAGPSFAFEATCKILGTPEYDKQVMEEAFDLGGGSPDNSLKGIAHEIIWRDRFNCSPENIENGRYAQLSNKRNDGMADVYVYDKANQSGPARRQLKDHDGKAGMLSTCAAIVQDNKYKYAELHVTQEAYAAYIELMMSPKDNICKKMNKPVRSSGISSQDTRRIVEMRKYHFLMRQVGDEFIDSTNKRWTAAELEDAPPHVKGAYASMRARQAQNLARDSYYKAVHDFTKSQFGKVANNNTVQGIVKLQEKADTAIAESTKIIAQSKPISRTITIAIDRLPTGITDFINRAQPVLGRLPWFKYIAVSATAVGTGYLAFEVYMNDDPGADAEARLLEAVKLLAKEGIVTGVSVGGTIAGAAAAGAMSGFICGPAAPVCITFTTAGGAIIGGIIAGFTADAITN